MSEETISSLIEKTKKEIEKSIKNHKREGKKLGINDSGEGFYDTLILQSRLQTLNECAEKFELLLNRIKEWRNTSIKDGKISLMITNGGYIEKFEVERLIREIGGGKTR